MSTTYKVVVDGSNIATEGRSRPSLGQLDEAVRAFIEEHPSSDVLVIVDSSFPNRIDPSESAIFEAAYNANEIITPPAGTIGRGDSFILRVADKLHATVFSNDSFQEFHGTYDWLFDKGRLVGGKPIPGLGWVFTPRTPVRGPKSRDAMREAKRTKVRVGSREASLPMPVPKAPPPKVLKQVADHALAIAEAAGERDTKRGKRKRAARKEEAVAAAVLAGAVDAVSNGDRKRKKRRRKGGAPAERPVEPMNDALPFLAFVAANAIASEIDGEVIEYSSHGLFVSAASAKCYVPLLGLAEPTPRSAKEIARKGSVQRWVVKSFDPLRRGIELALVGSPGSVGIVPVDSSTLDLDVDTDDAHDTPQRPSARTSKRAGQTAKAAKRRRGAKAADDAPADDVPYDDAPTGNAEVGAGAPGVGVPGAVAAAARALASAAAGVATPHEANLETAPRRRAKPRTGAPEVSSSRGVAEHAAEAILGGTTAAAKATSKAGRANTGPAKVSPAKRAGKGASVATDVAVGTAKARASRGAKAATSLDGTPTAPEKAVKATKTTKATKGATTAESPTPAKATKATKAVKAAKPVKATKAVKASPAAEPPAAEKPAARKAAAKSSVATGVAAATAASAKAGAAKKAAPAGKTAKAAPAAAKKAATKAAGRPRAAGA